EVGEPGIAGVTITIRDGNGDLVTTVTTEEDGSYQVLNLVPGDYRVEESDPSGYRSTTPNTVDVNVPSGGVAEADFGDQRLGEVNGTLYIDANGDGQRDPGEAPLADVTVVITDSLGAIYTVQTDAN